MAEQRWGLRYGWRLLHREVTFDRSGTGRPACSCGLSLAAVVGESRDGPASAEQGWAVQGLVPEPGFLPLWKPGVLDPAEAGGQWSANPDLGQPCSWGAVIGGSQPDHTRSEVTPGRGCAGEGGRGHGANGPCSHQQNHSSHTERQVWGLSPRSPQRDP